MHLKKVITKKTSTYGTPLEPNSTYGSKIILYNIGLMGIKRCRILRFIIGHNFLGHAPYKGPNFLFTTWTSWLSKGAEFYVYFKNINFP
jgi:hypothetical protein